MNRRSFFTALVAAPLAACYRPAHAGIPHPDRPSHAVDPKRDIRAQVEIDYSDEYLHPYIRYAPRGGRY